MRFYILVYQLLNKYSDRTDFTIGATNQMFLVCDNQLHRELAGILFS